MFHYAKDKVSAQVREQAQSYIKDSEFFLAQGDCFSAFGALDYAYGLLEGALREKGEWKDSLIDGEIAGK
ncbi:MAG: DUF357 domain-containing protein [Candidatus Micrarchaeota archaeon]|nr:DUF357 domain-containing protein [Candidatus Micrarchaeota archaeon]